MRNFVSLRKNSSLFLHSRFTSQDRNTFIEGLLEPCYVRGHIVHQKFEVDLRHVQWPYDSQFNAGCGDALGLESPQYAVKETVVVITFHMPENTSVYTIRGFEACYD